MVRNIHKLTPAFVARKSKRSGVHGDGGGLYLRVTPPSGMSWVYRYMIDGKAREMGLGSYPEISLPLARERAREARELKAQGQDPLDARESVRASLRLAAAKTITFRQCVESYFTGHKDSWKSAKTTRQWTAPLESYAMPIIGDLPVQSVDVGMVHRILEPIWNLKPETASRVRARIEAVLDWATARSYRTGDNPARWKGHLENLFPRRSKVQKTKHHAALDYRKMSEFMSELSKVDGPGAAALKFTILTAARTGEAVGAQWSEIDLDEGVWTVPGDRMKTGRAHRVPLSKPVVVLLRPLHKATGGKGFVFPGMRPIQPLGPMSLLRTLSRMGRGDLTVHGFRSTFRDWSEETTNFAGSVAESALGHLVGDKVEAAYRRGDLFDKRRLLMSAWGEFCMSPAQSGKVIPIGRTL